ncbi:MAG: XdhC family protein [Pseudomonadales bacterium]|nr:XdhC family protein [Pseudomonadales bacterium]
MDSATHAVLGFVNECLQQSSDCWLITVTKTWGSSPRLPGACLAWNKEYGHRGSLSGGCIEDDLLNKLASDFFSDKKQPFIESYGVTADQAEKFGLPCGGRLDLLMEYIPANPQQKKHFQQIVDALDERLGFARTVNMSAVFNDARTAEIKTSKPQPLKIRDSHITVYLGPRYRLVMIGANQVAHYLAEFCSALDFDVWVCDPREDAFSNWSIPFSQNFTQMPDDLIRERANDEFTAIVTLSHDPRVDDMALMEALTTQAFYVGAMGSSKTTKARKERLRQLDLTTDQLEKLIAPIGLAIGSKTPAEIAMSIAADLVRHIRVPA